jgi:hypothetical protein
LRAALEFNAAEVDLNSALIESKHRMDFRDFDGPLRTCESRKRIAFDDP